MTNKWQQAIEPCVPRVQEIITSIALLIPEPDQRKLLDLLFVAWDREGKNALNLEEFRNFKISIEPLDTQSPPLRRSARAFVIPHTPRGTVPQLNNPNRGAMTLMA